MLRYVKILMTVAFAFSTGSAAIGQVDFTTPAPFTSGTEPSITVVRSGFVIEVNQSGNDTSYMLGQLSGNTIIWGPSRVFPWKMYNARVSSRDDAPVIAVTYTGAPAGGGCFYRVGGLDPSAGLDQDISWKTSEEKWGTCDYTRDSRIRFNLDSKVFGLYSDFSQIYYRRGTMQNFRFVWTNGDIPEYVGDGRDVDFAQREDQMVEVYDQTGRGNPQSRPAKGATGGRQLLWGAPVGLPTTNAVHGHVTLNYSYPAASVVAIYYKAPLGLYTMTGRYIGLGVNTPPGIEWISPERPIAQGHVLHSDITNNFTSVIEVHEYQGQIYYSVGPMPPAHSAVQASEGPAK